VSTTVLTESHRRVDATYGIRVGVLLLVVVVRLTMSEPIDTGTGIALGLIGLFAAIATVGWVRVRRTPHAIVIADDEIRAEPSGARLDRDAGRLRLRRVGRRLGADTTLTGEFGDAELALRYLDPADVLDACADHGWPLAE